MDSMKLKHVRLVCSGPSSNNLSICPFVAMNSFDFILTCLSTIYQHLYVVSLNIYIYIYMRVMNTMVNWFTSICAQTIQHNQFLNRRKLMKVINGAV